MVILSIHIFSKKGLTGSNGNRTLWLALLLISCGALLGMTVFARKRKRT